MTHLGHPRKEQALTRGSSVAASGRPDSHPQQRAPPLLKPGMEAQYCLLPRRQKRAQVDLDKE